MPEGETWPVDSSQAMRVVSTQRLSAASTRKNQRGCGGSGDGSKLLRVQVGEQI